MTESTKKIFAMMTNGTITEAECRELITALSQKKWSRLNWFLDPFSVVQPWTALAMGLAISGVSMGVCGIFAMRSGGLLGLYVRIGDGASWITWFSHQIVVWPLAAAVFWGTAKLAKSRARLQDLIVYLGLARLPYLVMLLLIGFLLGDRARFNETAQGMFKFPSSVHPDSIRLFKSASPCDMEGLLVFFMPLLCWSVVLVLNTFRAATGLTGTRLTASFIVGSLVVELASLAVFNSLS